MGEKKHCVYNFIIMRIVDNEVLLRHLWVEAPVEFSIPLYYIISITIIGIISYLVHDTTVLGSLKRLFWLLTFTVFIL